MKPGYKYKTPESMRQRSREWRKNNPEKYKNQLLSWKFGISIEDYQRWFEDQFGKYAICGTSDIGYGDRNTHESN